MSDGARGVALGATSSRVLVFGGGIAGLAAAVTALENGAAVTLLEKAPQVGGTTQYSGGLLWTFGDYDDARAKVPDGDAALQWLVFDSLEESCTWLQNLGVRLGEPERVLGHGHGRSMDPAQLIEKLADRFAALGGELILETALESLVCRDGSIVGAIVQNGGHLRGHPARAVILATGGFQGNAELLARYVLRDPDNVVLRASPWSTGDAFIAATSIGAAASPGLNTFYGHALAAFARYSPAQFRDVSQYHGGISVALNLDGERFADETEDTGEEALNQSLARQRKGRGVYIVDDSAMDLHPIQGRESVTRSILQRARSAGGTVIEAATLEDLCKALAPLGIPGEYALKTLREFNTAITSGRADELTVPRQRLRNALVRAPFRAVAVQSAITFTMGGLWTDERARVLRRSGTTSSFGTVPVERAYTEGNARVVALGNNYRQTPIPGLYAAGNDVGNISHFGYMGGLASALTTARVAGREASKLVSLHSCI